MNFKSSRKHQTALSVLTPLSLLWMQICLANNKAAVVGGGGGGTSSSSLELSSLGTSSSLGLWSLAVDSILPSYVSATDNKRDASGRQELESGLQEEVDGCRSPGG
ncbi:hypothetical protein BGX38DRAFT_1233363 [Terfezia claveryi]|nr:hypothetical protein BGX38DRAFT_1233363 [Terfezia claveryi]